MAPIENGFWGKPTATIDWCEENYVINFYIAEFWNTISNIFLLLGPLTMVIVGLKENHEKQFVCSQLAVSVVGLGSWLFHMTLQYSMQLMDELPMIWGSSFLIYSLYTIRSKPNEKSMPLQVLLFSYCVLVTLVYIITNVPVFHEVAYGIMVTAMVFLAGRLVMTIECHRLLCAASIVTYGFGFLLWNIDNMYCHHLRALRNHPMGQASGMLFQFHAWWHVLTGIGTYLSLLFALHTRYIFLQHKPQIKYIFYVWPYVTVQPEGIKQK